MTQPRNDVNGPQPDSELIEQVRASNADAFRLLFERYQPVLFRNALFLTRDSDQAHEIVQETFVRIWKHRARLKPSLGFLPFALRIGTNLVRDSLRHRRFQVTLGPETRVPAASNGGSPGEALDRKMLHERVMEAVRRDLPERCREVFLLSRIEQKTNAEIAALLGLSLKTVENQISHALKVLRKKLA